MIKKIAITGPESTGKSTLTLQLAKHFGTSWVDEYAREYINQLDRPYSQNDILEIAKKQKEEQLLKLKQAHQFFFADTELIVTKIWSEIKYQNCHPWILQEIKKQDFDLYLLCDIRPFPGKQILSANTHTCANHLFGLYKSELEQRNLNFKIISGNEQARLQQALRYIETFL